MRATAAQLTQGDFSEFGELRSTLSSYAEQFAEVAADVDKLVRVRFGESHPASDVERRSSLVELIQHLEFETQCTEALGTIQALRGVTSTATSDPALDAIHASLDELEQFWRSAEVTSFDPAEESIHVKSHPVAQLRELVETGAEMSDSAWLGTVDDLRDELGGAVIAAAIRQRLCWPHVPPNQMATPEE